MHGSKGTSLPIKRESRPAGTGRLPKCQLGGDTEVYTTQALRVQRLRLLGILGARAELLARLAWGEAA